MDDEKLNVTSNRKRDDEIIVSFSKSNSFESRREKVEITLKCIEYITFIYVTDVTADTLFV